MLRVAICEDCPRQTNIILSLLEKYQADRPGVVIEPFSFASGNELLKSLTDRASFDLFLLDILLPELDGVEVAREIRAGNANVPIVFLTSSADYAMDAFRVYAIQYILKPIDVNKLFTVLDKVVASQKYESERLFALTMPKQIMSIPFASIICVELAGRSLLVYHTNGDKYFSSSIRTKFELAVSPLLEDGRFLCPHKSFVINMEHVEELSDDSFIMKHETKIPIPQYRYAEAKTGYFAWLSEQGVGCMGDEKA